jgi:hypothetical protein
MKVGDFVVAAAAESVHGKVSAAFSILEKDELAENIRRRRAPKRAPATVISTRPARRRARAYRSKLSDGNQSLRLLLVPNLVRPSSEGTLWLRNFPFKRQNSTHQFQMMVYRTCSEAHNKLQPSLSPIDTASTADAL